MRAGALWALLCALAPGQPAPDFRGSFVLSIDGEPVRYGDPPADDPVARLQRRLDAGELKLEWREPRGYLDSLLKVFGVPVSSQGLVFSKTSFQLQRISPATPRAIYFGDDVYAGWVPEGDVIEVSAADPVRGGMFYTLAQNPETPPVFRRRDVCLQCHASPSTLGVPGHLVRSVYPDAQGYPHTTVGSFVTSHRSPFAERWGGWFVTGAHGAMRHMGNARATDPKTPEALDREKGANQSKVPADLSSYASPHSDIVALMTLEHQTAMHNYLARAGMEARIALHTERELNKALGKPANEEGETAARQLANAAEILTRNLLFANEAPLTARVEGTSAFAAEFPRQGSHDKQGRSLREFDLEKRIFRYPCSYLVYSPAFAQLPERLKRRVFARMEQVLSGAEQSPAWAGLSPEDRRAVREILRDTLPGYPRD